MFFDFIDILQHFKFENWRSGEFENSIFDVANKLYNNESLELIVQLGDVQKTLIPPGMHSDSSNQRWRGIDTLVRWNGNSDWGFIYHKKPHDKVICLLVKFWCFLVFRSEQQLPSLATSILRSRWRQSRPHVTPNKLIPAIVVYNQLRNACRHAHSTLV